MKKSSDSDWSSATVLDDLTGVTYTWSSLPTGVPHDFRLETKSIGELYSTSLFATETPVYPVTVDGAPYYGTLQDALTYAGQSSQGGTVVMGVMTYQGNLTLPANVSLKGHSPHDTRIIGDLNGPVLRIEGDANSLPVEISNLSVTNGTTGIEMDGGDLRVGECRHL